MSDLKPCPFCGGKAILLQSGFVFQVQCGSCGASGRNDDKTTSVAHWNTRTELERECIWTRVNNSNHCWDEYDAWSTSCGEDYAIEEEWDDKVPNYCNNCGGKAKKALNGG